MASSSFSATSKPSSTDSKTTTDSTIPHVIFVLGPPGAGKGTVCHNIVRDFGLEHLSAGDLLRIEQQTPHSPFGELIATHIRNGTIVPVEVTCSLLERAMHASGRRYFLIDGFPRNADNLSGWQRQMPENKAHVEFCIFLECTEDICVRRIQGRASEAGSAVRADDNMESLRLRFQTYSSSTLPIVQKYEELGLLRRIDASLSVDKVYDQVRPLFAELALPTTAASTNGQTTNDKGGNVKVLKSGNQATTANFQNGNAAEQHASSRSQQQQK